MVGFSLRGEKSILQEVEWIQQQLHMNNKELDYPVYGLSLPPPHSLSMHILGQHPAFSQQSPPPPPSKFLPTQLSESYLTEHCNLCILTVA